ncbi:MULTISPECIES: fimbrial protein [Klebsiella]|uniref:fimbrial protein n=1 Tax=Klebsiella TaxID=570 RepID=UPI00115A1264|nr:MULTISPECIES: fimbrial protein [Klebsiella]MBZ7661742.1 fimbrial protein [Klebsiella grimontii]VUS97994.1 putative fimbrial-like protein YfcQ [Klebsiella pasteurii]
MCQRITAALLLNILLVSICPAMAANEADIVFKGTLVNPPPCAIDNDQTIHVAFGDRLAIKKVSDGIYREEVGYNLVCDSAANKNWKLMLSVRGNLATFDTADQATVATSVGNIGNLGVKILRDGQPFKFDSPAEISLSALPKIEALLVQRPGVELVEGPFEATVTLKAEYL